MFFTFKTVFGLMDSFQTENASKLITLDFVSSKINDKLNTMQLNIVVSNFLFSYLNIEKSNNYYIFYDYCYEH